MKQLLQTCMSWLPVGRAYSDPVRQRRLVLAVLLLVMFAVSVGRLWYVQIGEGEHFASRSTQQRAASVELPARRGMLLDRNGDVLATSADAAAIFGDPQAFEGEGARPVEDAAAALAPLLGGTEEGIAEQLRGDSRFVYLARQVSWDVGQQVRELGIDGIGVLVEPARIYPSGQLAAQVLGFTDVDRRGQGGIELVADTQLRGEPGTVLFERAPGGLTITTAPREVEAPTQGADVVLTLDRAIQHKVEQVAATTAAETGAAAVSITVADVDTGELLALTTEPGFDPSDRSSLLSDAARLRSVTDQFEPGSVQKALTAAALFEAGVTSPDKTLTVPNQLRAGGHVFSDVGSRGTEELTFGEVMALSSNTGVILAAQELGEQRLHDTLTRFGLGRQTGVGFPGEAAGALRPVEEWWATSLPTVAIGQGLSVTQLQLLDAYATIARGGERLQPRLVRGHLDTTGELVPAPPEDPERVLSAEAAEMVQEVLVEVVEGERATGSAAQVPGFQVAGKTGTAQKVADDGRGYSEEYIASFVGFAPADAPRVVVAVTVDEPERSQGFFGSVVAAPAFAEVTGFTLQHLRVPPSADASS